MFAPSKSYFHRKKSFPVLIMNDDSPISRGVSVLGLSRSEINSPQISVITLHKRKPSISIVVRINAEFPKYVWAR